MGEPRDIRITIPYAPRKQFLAFHNRTQRYSVGVAHRRAGKTVAHINELVRGALTCPLQRPRFAYLAPLRNQAKAVAWDYLKHYAMVVPGTTANEAELRVNFPNEGEVRLFGADNPEQLRGQYFDGVVLDEYAQMRGFAWSEIIRPCLADRKGWAAFIGTPMGRNSFYELMYGDPNGTWKGAVNDPEWFTFTLKASETNLLDATELTNMRKSMSVDQYAQELECSFEAAIIGSYYGKLMNDLAERGRLTKIDWEPDLVVDTFWDLGIGNSTAIWFAQKIGNEIRLIDHYEASGAGMVHYAEQIKSRKALGWQFGEHVLPHDGRTRMQDETGKTRQEILANLGIETRCLRPSLVDDGIEAARVLLPKCWFDADRCRRGIEALRQYKREYDDKLKAFSRRPYPDWTSHSADAFRYLAVGIGPGMGVKIGQDAYAKPRSRRDVTWMSA